MKKVIITVISIIMILFMISITTACQDDGGSPDKDGFNKGAVSFESKEQVKEVVDEYNTYYKTKSRFSFGCGNGSYASDDADLEYAQNGSAIMSYSVKSTETTDYTQTNTQEKDIDEGDIIKTDGEYIYYLSFFGLHIIKAQSDGGMQKVYSDLYGENDGEDTDGGYEPIEMYVYENTLITIGSDHENYYVSGGDNNFACCYYGGASNTEIRFYNIENKSEPSLKRRISVDGAYNTSRLKDGYLYYICQDSFRYGNSDDYIPKILDTDVGENAIELDVKSMYYFEGIAIYNHTLVGKIKADGTGENLVKGYLGCGNTIYVSQNYIYITATDESEKYTYIGNGYYKYDDEKNDFTRIVRLNLSDVGFSACATVEGEINDRYAMDEYDGYFRIATTSYIYTDDSYSGVYVFDKDLNKIGEVINIAKGERIYSARFDKTTANIVTFKTIDPLFKVDLSDPTKPTVSDGLKKDGVSYYLHHVEGTDLLIGLGYGTKDNGYGGTTTNGIEVALFDNSGTENTLINRITIGQNTNGGANCDAIYNPKEILYDKDKDIFCFSASVYEYDSAYNYNVKNGYFVFGFMGGTLTLKANLQSDLNNVGSNKSVGSSYYYESYYSEILRGARIGNYIYTFTRKDAKSYNLSDFSPMSSLALVSIEYDEQTYSYIIK